MRIEESPLTLIKERLMPSAIIDANRKTPEVVKATAPGPLSAEELGKMHAYWRAANYLAVGQIYLMDNPLLKEPLQLKHVKPRLLGHWGTTSGQNFLYVHLNRVIKAYDLNMLYISGPGHGGPALVANAYLEGTYSEVYPNIGQDEAGLKRLFTQFSFPGGIPSHVAPETPGSMHEGGELGYALSHAYGAAFDNPEPSGRTGPSSPPTASGFATWRWPGLSWTPWKGSTSSPRSLQWTWAPFKRSMRTPQKQPRASTGEGTVPRDQSSEHRHHVGKQSYQSRSGVNRCHLICQSSFSPATATQPGPTLTSTPAEPIFR
jgi:hypothetical protein